MSPPFAIPPGRASVPAGMRELAAMPRQCFRCEIAFDTCALHSWEERMAVSPKTVWRKEAAKDRSWMSVSRFNDRTRA
jgi:hypothetical protein